ncbi:hypothetical protein ZOSMA_3083G00020 [Zostera marina]|uniref:RRM domain-containing protein n=1 Tax=Zostera marina TaxID=29655 RepID=A0A0K9PCB4_ZOSMR|nr:hypothetical protein ZOSMA_3083G00020 [Zostera marina]
MAAWSLQDPFQNSKKFSLAAKIRKARNSTLKIINGEGSVVITRTQLEDRSKVVPRDDQHVLNRTTNTANINNNNAHVYPGPTRTKKIFVGGLASTVTESDFKTFFDQFGNITDVVVMYDHNTQRPRGFGFITYDSEDAVDKVLLTTFHKPNNKMVEVKQVVPKGYCFQRCSIMECQV